MFFEEVFSHVDPLSGFVFEVSGVERSSSSAVGVTYDVTYDVTYMYMYDETNHYRQKHRQTRST
jgi:hypothetical protein